LHKIEFNYCELELVIGGVVGGLDVGELVGVSGDCGFGVAGWTTASFSNKLGGR